MRKIFYLLLLMWLLGACHLPTSPTSTPPFDGIQPTLTPTPSPPAEVCAWVWASQPLPEISARLQAAMQAAGVSNVTAYAEVFGENCISTQNQVLRFAARQTDFRITVLVDTLANAESLGQTLQKILGVLDGFPPEATPGPNPGYIGVTFLTKGESLHLWFSVGQGVEARARGLHGAALLEALKTP